MAQRNISKNIVLQSKYIKLTDVFSASIIGQIPNKLDLINIKITPISTTSKMLVRVGLTGSIKYPTNFANGEIKFGLYRDNTLLGTYFNRGRSSIISPAFGQNYAGSPSLTSQFLTDFTSGYIFDIKYEHEDIVTNQKEITYCPYIAPESANIILFVNRTGYVNAPIGYSYIEVSEIER